MSSVVDVLLLLAQNGALVPTVIATFGCFFFKASVCKSSQENFCRINGEVVASP